MIFINFIGDMMILAFFIIIYVITAKVTSFKEATLAFVVAFLGTVWIVIGVKLACAF